MDKQEFTGEVVRDFNPTFGAKQVLSKVEKQLYSGEMAIMSAGHGDLKVIWDADRTAEVDSARAQFDKLVGKGYAAFKVDKKGEKGEQIKTFDPSAEKIILAPALQGG